MRERRNNILGDGMRRRFDEMETIAAANVMRMRRGKRQYRWAYVGDGIASGGASKDRIPGLKRELTKGKRRRRCVEAKGSREDVRLLPDGRAQSIITLRLSLKALDLTGRSSNTLERGMTLTKGK